MQHKIKKNHVTRTLLGAACTALLGAQLLWAAPMQPSLPQADPSWKKIGADDNVLVYSKEIPNSDIVAFRGETIIDAPIAKVANVLIDADRETEWVFHGVSAKIIRQISQYERVEYNHTSSGFFLVRDRDFVFQAKAVMDKQKRQMDFQLHEVEDPAMPPTSHVRGSIDRGRYLLTMVSPTQTHLIVEIQADPKGSLPKWVVNLFQKSWPSKTLNGIRAQCAKADVIEHPGVKAFFADAMPTKTN